MKDEKQIREQKYRRSKNIYQILKFHWVKVKYPNKLIGNYEEDF